MWVSAMEKTQINRFFLFAVLDIACVCAFTEEFYFQLFDDPNNTGCSDHVARVGTAVSAIRCGADCSRNVNCRGVVYDEATMACKEVHRNYTFPDPTCQAENGAAYYSEVCDRFLVSGPHGVNDSQLSESSNFCDVNNPASADCQPPWPRPTSAVYARINNTGMLTGGWIPGYWNHQQYVQVDLLKATIVTRVVMQGRDPVINPNTGETVVRYVKRFKLLHSDDCSTFEELTDNNGDTVILDGNSSPYETIFRDLPRRVKARCFRINPVEWFIVMSLRFDLLGCP